MELRSSLSTHLLSKTDTAIQTVGPAVPLCTHCAAECLSDSVQFISQLTIWFAGLQIHLKWGGKNIPTASCMMEQGLNMS